MAEALLRVVDKVNSDFYLNIKCLKRGDVVTICPDGWEWSHEELTNPDWRIIKLPNVSIEALSQLTVPEMPPDSINQYRTLHRRKYRINIDALPNPVKNYINDSSRKNPFFSTNVDITSFITQKAAIADPNAAPSDFLIS